MYYIDHSDFFCINKNTDRLVIAFYPPRAGGKFLLNCLGLSDNFVLQDQSLAKQQLEGKFTGRNKLELLLERLDQVDDHWNDLNLGCLELFGDHSYKDTTAAFFDIGRHGKFFPVIRKLSISDVYFPTVAHNLLELKNTLYHWPNAKVIQLNDSEKFRTKYHRTASKNFWNDIKGKDWPAQAPETIEQYFQLPEWVRKELSTHGSAAAEVIRQLLWDSDKKHLDSENQKFLDQILCSCSKLYQWDVDWYLEEASMLKELQTLYEKLNLNDFNADYISTFYKAYTKKLSEIAELNSN